LSIFKHTIKLMSSKRMD